MFLWRSTYLPVLGALVVLTALISLPARPALGATFTVTKTADTNDGTCDADCSLREAIVAGNDMPGADTIGIPAGTYTLSIAGAGEDLAATGDLDIVDNRTIQGQGAATTIIDGGGLDRVFHIVSGTTSVSGLTVRNGSESVSGGGIYNTSILTLTNATVSGNSAPYGAAIINKSGGSLFVNNSTLGGNTASQQGGGILNEGGAGLILDTSTVSGNSASYGGGIVNGGSLTVDSSTISSNSATADGGGVANNGGGTVTLTTSTVGGNISSDDGGGIYNFGAITLNSSTVSGSFAADIGGGIYNSGTVTLNSSTANGNVAAHGGGIGSNGTLTVNSSTVSNNSASSDGGGIFTDSALTLNSSTISSNSASSAGGGIYNNVNSTTILKNTIVANSLSGGNCSGIVVTSNGYNLSSDSSCGFGAVGDMQNVDPKLGPLAFYGGPTPTHALLDGSPAVDVGVVPCPPPGTDQRGVSRPQGLRCDIGAYEAPDSDGDGVADPKDQDDDNDGFLDASDPCRTAAEDADGFQDTDGCPDPDNDGDSICDPGMTSVSCTGSDSGQNCFDPAGTLSCPVHDCRNTVEDMDAFKDSDGCPEPDNDNDSFNDGDDQCDGSDSSAGADGMLGSPQDLNHNGIKDGAEATLTTDDVPTYAFEDRDGVLDTDGCHDSPGEDFDGDGFTDDVEALSIGTNAGYPCGNGGWPLDFASGGIFDSTNRVEISDLHTFLIPRRLDTNPGDPSFNPRWDLSPGPGLFTDWINIADLNAMLTGSSGSPPMLGGARAFDGPSCPYPP